jgi:hypothetical protein
MWNPRTALFISLLWMAAFIFLIYTFFEGVIAGHWAHFGLTLLGWLALSALVIVGGIS